MAKHYSYAAVVIMLFAGPMVSATPIGRPVSLDVTVTQGSDTIVTATGVAISPTDPLDGLTYMKLSDINGGTASIYLAMWMQDPTGASDEGLLGFAIRTGDPCDPLIPGPALFDLTGSGMINVVIDNLQFEIGGQDTSVTVAEFGTPVGDKMSAMYMFDVGGWYYLLPETETVWIGAKKTHQVPYSDFKDDNHDEYDFKDGFGTSIDIGWYNMFSPVDATYDRVLSDSPYTQATDPTGGKVYEIGLSAFAYGNQIPEPATLGLLLVGLGLIHRRR